MSQCPTCDAELSDELGACPHCATSAEEAHRCERCGESFVGDSCPACGYLRVPVPCETHPDRTAGARCVACGRALCEACRVAGPRVALCEDHRTVMVIEGWAQVYTTASEFEAQLVRDNLLAEGIDAQIYSQRDNIFSVDLGELSIVRLLVPVWEYAHALQLIRDHMDVEGEVVFACPACGEAFDPGARECTACGAPLG